MKRTIKSLLLAAWIVSAAACSKDEAGSEMNSNELYTVSIRLNQIEQSAKPITKATTTLPDTLRLRVIMNVFDRQGQFAYSDEILLNETGSEIPVQFQVKKGTYDLAFWADYVLYKNGTVVSEAYNAADLRNISINNAMSSDAFSLLINDVVVDGDVAITSGTELSRAVALLKIESNQTVPAGFASIQYSLSQSVSSINLLTGESTINSSGTFFSNTLTVGETLSVSRYIFPCDPFTCSINLLNQNGTPVRSFEVENVETQKNVQTVLKGDFFSENTSSGSLSLTINQEWDADKVYIVEPAITAIPIADANFKAYLVANFDTDGDGEISAAEAKQVTTIDVNTDNIYSLDGIEYFTNLTQLACKGTSEWDSNSNSYIGIGKLTEINLSKNTLLFFLDCGYNQLTQLDLSNNTQLNFLNSQNNPLTNLNLSNNTELSTLCCVENQLTELDLSNNTQLTNLHCLRNQLTQLDLSNNMYLMTLECYDNSLTELDLSNNTQLVRLACQNNQLAQLDLSNNSSLEHIECNDNQLTTLDVSNNPVLAELICKNNLLTQLNIDNCPELTLLYCENNNISELDLTTNTNLSLFICSNNSLTSLDLSNASNLNTLSCATNKLNSLNLSLNTQLSNLICADNQLTQLDISNNMALETVNCLDNPLETIYVCEGYSFSLNKPETTQIVVK